MSNVARPRSRPTIRDVAAHAGVGIKTVSRVINDEPNVSDAMRTRVQASVEELNFQPNQSAGSLRRGDRRTQTIGLLLDAVDNPFAAAISRAVELVAAEHDTAVFAASSGDDVARERRLIEAFTRRRVDGLILTSIETDHHHLAFELEQGTPIVFVDRPPVGLEVDAVLTDNRAGAAAGTRHLLAHGHRSLAYLGDELTISTAVQRRLGFLDAIAEVRQTRRPNDPALISIMVDDLDSAAAAEAAVTRLLTGTRRPTALFTAQNLITVGAVAALHRLGLQYEVALVGFDDLLLADLLDPPVTVLAQDPHTIGTTAATRIFDRLAGERPPASTHVVPATLIPRGSGEIRPH